MVPRNQSRLIREVPLSDRSASASRLTSKNTCLPGPWMNKRRGTRRGHPLGHASVQLTLDRYSHWMPSMGRNTAEGIDEALG